MATHLSLYPAILIVPVRAITAISIYSFFRLSYLPLNCIVGFLTPWQVILLLGYGPDAPPTKVFLVKSSSDSKSDMSEYDKRTSLKVQRFSWMTVLHFIFWLIIWSCYVLLLSSMILKKVGGLNEMFEK
jgi:GPI-anchor transamidase subunit U